MDLRQMEYFIACAQTRNFSVAAEQLYTSQPHVSEVIRSLEKELGTTLFYRNTRGVELTEAGRKNYEFAVNIIKNAKLMQQGTALREKKSFKLFTNSSSNMAVLFAKFYKQHPDYHYSYIEDGVEGLLERIAQHEAELGFIFLPDNKRTALNYALERKSLQYVPLVKSDMVVYVGRENPLYGSRKVLSLEELSRLRFVQMSDDFFSFRELLNEQQGAKLLQPDKVVETNSNHAMIQLLNTSELCNLCSYWLKDRYKYYDFQMLPVKGLENKISFGYVKQLHGELTPLAQDFLQHIIKAIEEENS